MPTATQVVALGQATLDKDVPATRWTVALAAAALPSTPAARPAHILRSSQSAVTAETVLAGPSAPYAATANRYGALRR
jgi:hypothetical protein